MSTEAEPRKTAPKKSKKGGIFFPALCDLLGTLAILAVIAALLPVTVPRLLGYQVFDVVSGSMAPAIPRGSLVLVRPTDASEIREGDVIAFHQSGSVVTHRVIRIEDETKKFITKGDANEDPDMSPIAFASLIGRVERSVPVLGSVCARMTTVMGKVYALAVLTGGVILRVLARWAREA